ncbi:MAG: hypothetical protein F6J95_020730 [Leptolyngbya sp. SIO1E4]|nr:hypothetical protein [Leptolyngbya sp. SIO1E4]
MATRLIQLEDDVLIEAEVPDEQVEQISSGLVKRVDSTFATIKPLLLKTCKPIAASWKELNQEVYIEQAEVELGLGFEGEGNLYITKSTATANLTIKLVLKPKSE